MCFMIFQTFNAHLDMSFVNIKWCNYNAIYDRYLKHAHNKFWSSRALQWEILERQIILYTKPDLKIYKFT